jgi:hypothetical protein
VENKLEKEVRYLKAYALLATLFGAVLVLTAFTLKDRKQTFDEITVKRINVVDSKDSARVVLAGEFPGRRSHLAGLLFNNADGTESGGLVYSGSRNKEGKIDGGSILTFDQYKNDQVVSLGYDHNGDEKRLGLIVNDRPDNMSDLVKEAYRAIETAKTPAEAEIARKNYLPRIPARDIVARRLFAGRDVQGSSLVTLSDQDGKPRLRLQVDKNGKASIEFLDQSGKVTKTIKP